ncbi:MAG: NUDIX domain-containing protein [Propionibacteriales bacterium]|nr:NUDIX domain-containing protein [Propionibacteriales bacterium]
MTIYGLRRSVACYVTRTTDRGDELLVFEYLPDNASGPSGVHIPTGEMARFEAIEDAARREVEHSAGVTELSFERQLGAFELGLRDAGGPSVTTFVHLTARNDGEASWQHTVAADDEGSASTIAWRWEPLPLTCDLAPNQDLYLDQLTA